MKKDHLKLKRKGQEQPEPEKGFPAFCGMQENLMVILIQILMYASVASLLLLPLLFVYLNTLQSSYFIDEKFHIPQTLQYCSGNLSEWDPKITTLPGLYLFSALILGPFNLCSTTSLRLINLLCTYVNLILAYSLVSILRGAGKNDSGKVMRRYSSFLTAWNIAFFPPLLFWFFLFYTDIFSVTLILTMFLLPFHNRNILAAIVGGFAICVRQTNVIWVALLGLEKSLNSINEITRKPHLTDTYNLLPCIRVLWEIFLAEARRGIIPFFKFIKLVCQLIFPYLLVGVLFIAFVIYNGGIVVGDRTAHVPTIHITQILYYSAFVFCFAWPYLLPHLRGFLQFLRQHFIVSSCFLLFLVLVVYYNTLVHPYILADNRHYSFYIWKNLMNRYGYFRYLPIPAYAFSIYAIFQSLNHFRLLSLIAYMLCVCAVLVPQLLLEPRYFIIPYVLFRLNQSEPKKWQLVAETLTTVFVNIAQFSLFVSKSFSWKDEAHPQRIAW